MADYITALLEGGCAHATLDAFHQVDILDLQYHVDVFDRPGFCFARCGSLEEKIKFFVAFFRARGKNFPDYEIAPARVAHQGGIGPQTPDCMISHRFAIGQ